MITWKNPFGRKRKTADTLPPEPATESVPADTAPMKQPVASPAATKKRSPKPKLALFSDPLSAFPADTNLVGKPAVTIAFAQEAHTIQLRDSGIFVDGIKYIVSATDSVAFGSEAPLTLFDARIDGKHLCITAGTGSDKHTVRLDAEELGDAIRKLQQGRTVECSAGDKTVQIARQMY